MKQTMPMSAIPTTSAAMNGASVNYGCISINTISPTNNMLTWNSKPIPAT